MKIKGHLEIELEPEDSVTVVIQNGLLDEIEINIRDKIVIVNTPEKCQAYGYRIVPTNWEGNKLEEFLLQ